VHYYFTSYLVGMLAAIIYLCVCWLPLLVLASNSWTLKGRTALVTGGSKVRLLWLGNCITPKLTFEGYTR